MFARRSRFHDGSVDIADRQPGRKESGRGGVRPGNDQKCRLAVWDIASAQSLFSAEGMALAYSPDGRWLAVAAADEKTVLLLDARTHETTARFSGHESASSRPPSVPTAASRLVQSRSYRPPVADRRRADEASNV